jgi:hypothetical protein
MTTTTTTTKNTYKVLILLVYSSAFITVLPRLTFCHEWNLQVCYATAFHFFMILQQTISAVLFVCIYAYIIYVYIYIYIMPNKLHPGLHTVLVCVRVSCCHLSFL